MRYLNKLHTSNIVIIDIIQNFKPLIIQTKKLL